MPLFSRSNTTLPSVSDIDLPEMPQGLAAYTPLIAGAAMIGAGLLLRRTEPDTLRLPEPANHRRHDRGLRWQRPERRPRAVVRLRRVAHVAGA